MQAFWALSGPRGNVYRVPLNQLTIGTVTKGPFEDYIAVRGAIAPLITDYLTTDQGGTVKQVLVEDGAMVKKGQPLIVLSNPALQLQVAVAAARPSSRPVSNISTISSTSSIRSKSCRNDLARDKILLDGNAIAPSNL